MIDIVIKVLLIMSVLLVFAVPGFVLRKKNFVRAESTYSLSNILLYVCQPLLIVKSFAVDPIEPSGKILLNFSYVFLFSIAAMLLTFAVANIFFTKMKEERKRKDIFVFISIFSNCGFVGIPFIDMFTKGMGADVNARAKMYVIVFNAAFNVLVWTLGAYLVTQDKKQISVKKAILNPCTVGTLIGFLLFLLPQINIFNMESVKELQQIVVFTGNMTAPLSMMIVGVRVAELSPKALFKDKGVYLSAAMRLLVAPALTFLIVLPFKLWGVFNDDIYLLLAPVIAMAMPPAATVVAFAERFGGERESAAAAYATGTLSSLITLPLVLVLITL